KKYSFTELERLVKQAQKTKKKANQQKRRLKKQVALRVKRAKEASRQQKKTRLKEIYSYFRQELNKLEKSKHPQYFTPHLKFGSKYTVYKLNKQGSAYLIKQTRQAYQEESISQANQLKYYKDKIGSLNPSTKEFLKSEQFKYFFPEKGEHKELFRRRKEFIAEREKILTEFKGQQVKISPQPTKSHYLRAIGKMLRKTGHEGELVPDSEIELDKYGNPKFKEGQ
ncbi:184_t:CDS:2, partial [Racocetra persica]